MSEFVKQLLIVCPLLFLAGLCDSIAGGGGTISLPALMLAGLPTHFALGTNKMCMSMGTAVSVYRYGKEGRIRWFVSLVASAGAILGAIFGAKLALLIDDRYMRYVLLVLLPASALFLTLNRNFGQEGREKAFPPTKTAFIAFLCGAGVGAYDGFFGPGAGTFYIMALSAALGIGFTEATADTRVINLASNIGALITFILNGKVLWALALPGMACTMAGNYVGSGLAMKNGARFVRPVMVVMIALLFLKTVFDF